MVKETVCVAIHKDLVKVILRVKSEMIKQNKSPSTARITKKIAKVLNMRDLIR